MHPDTISSDLTAAGQSVHSLMECMSKFMALGYSLADVVRMTTANAAKAIGMDDEIGSLAVGREADITILDANSGNYRFFDSIQREFTGSVGITPVHTVRAGELFAPGWGTHPWGWLPEIGADRVAELVEHAPAGRDERQRNELRTGHNGEWKNQQTERTLRSGSWN